MTLKLWKINQVFEYGGEHEKEDPVGADAVGCGRNDERMQAEQESDL